MLKSVFLVSEDGATLIQGPFEIRNQRVYFSDGQDLAGQ